MRKSMTGFLRWGALLLQCFVLFILYGDAFMFPGPFNAGAIGLMAVLAAVSLMLAVVSSAFWDRPYLQPPPPIWQIAFKPPMVLWALAVIPPAIRTVSAVSEYYQTGKWSN